MAYSHPLCLFEQLRPVFRSQRHNFFHQLGLLGFTELRRRRSPSRNGCSDCREEVVLSGRRANADQTSRVGRGVVKTMGGVGGNVDGVARLHDRFLTTKRRFHFAFQENEGLLEVMPMRRRASSRRNMHIDYAEPPGCLRSGNGDGVGVSHQT